MAQNNPFQLTPTDILSVFGGQNAHSRTVQSSYHSGNFEGSFDVLSSASHSTTVPGFVGGYNTSGSSVLEALHGLGAMASKFPAGQAYMYMQDNVESPSPSIDCKPFSSLNLKTVDEEDEFLYGDSNSLPDAPKVIREVSTKSDAPTPHTMWSDEDDPYNESSLNTPASQNKKNEDNKNANAYRKHSPTVDSQISVRSVEQTSSVSNKSSVDSKSKYHVAAEILKKQSLEKSKLINKMASNDKLGHISESPKSSYDVESKSEEANLTGTRQQRQLPKAFAKKQVDNINDFLHHETTKRKRLDPPEEFGPGNKQLRHENLQPEHHSYDSSRYDHRFPKERPQKPSPYIWTAPGYDFDRKHDHQSIKFGHKPFSRSPGRRSRDRSPGIRRRSPERSPGTSYRRSRERSPGMRRRSRERSPSIPRYRESRRRSKSPGNFRSRRRSRSPGYRSRDKSFDKYEKKSRYSRSPEKYSSKKKLSSRSYSRDSYCSLILDSSSSTSDSSHESLAMKNKKTFNKTPISKKKPSINNRNDNEIQIFNDAVKASVDSMSKNSSVPYTDKGKGIPSSADLTKSFIENEGKLSEFVEFMKTNQLMTKVFQEICPPAEQSSAYASTSVADNMHHVVSNPQMCVPTSYYAVPPVPVPYMQPQVNTFPPVIPHETFPTPIPPSAPFAQYIAPAAPVDPHTIKTNLPRPNLRTIPVSDTSPTSSKENTNVTATLTKSSQDNLAKSSSYDSTKSSPASHDSPKPRESSKQAFEKKIKELKAKEGVKNDTDSKSAKEITSTQNKAVMIEKFKKLKLEKQMAHMKMNNSVNDIVEMRNMLESTFGKKVSASEKMIHSKCKNLLNVANDSVNSYIKEAKRADDEFCSFRLKLPTAVKQEINNLKVEPTKEEDPDGIYACFDSGEHVCYDCNVQFRTITEVMTHIQTPEHQEIASSGNQGWKKHFKKEVPTVNEKQKSLLAAVKGIEFMKPLTAFFCALCQETVLERADAEQHVKGHDHYVNFKEFTKKNPLYERKCLFKRYIQINMSVKQKKLKEVEEKKKQMVESNYIEENPEKKPKDTSENAKKEVKSEEISKGSQNSQKATDSSSGEKLKDKNDTSEKSKSSKDTTKFVYIGKAPQFKKSLSQAGKPWYKRETYLNKNDLDDIPTPNVSNATNFTENKLELDENKTKTPSKSQTLNDSAKNSKLIADNMESSNKNKSQAKSIDPVVSQALKNILHGTDTSRHNLSKITLPESSLKQNLNKAGSPAPKQNLSKAVSPVPMDIDNSQDSKAKPKLASEEEKDFFILGINKEDFKPLVIPVPPPNHGVPPPITSVPPPNPKVPPPNHNASVPPYSVSTSVPMSNLSFASDIKPNAVTMDFSVPPPSIAPYQNNIPNVPVYGNVNNTTPVMGYSYPNNTVYPNHGNMMHNQPPISQYGNRPPMNPYPNQHVSQFSNPNNFQSNAQYPNNLQHNASFANRFPNNNLQPHASYRAQAPNQNNSASYGAMPPNPNHAASYGAMRPNQNAAPYNAMPPNRNNAPFSSQKKPQSSYSAPAKNNTQTCAPPGTKYDPSYPTASNDNKGSESKISVSELKRKATDKRSKNLIHIQNTYVAQSKPEAKDSKTKPETDLKSEKFTENKKGHVSASDSHVSTTTNKPKIGGKENLTATTPAGKDDLKSSPKSDVSEPAKTIKKNSVDEKVDCDVNKDEYKNTTTSKEIEQSVENQSKESEKSKGPIDKSEDLKNSENKNAESSSLDDSINSNLSKMKLITEDYLQWLKQTETNDDRLLSGSVTSKNNDQNEAGKENKDTPILQKSKEQANNLQSNDGDDDDTITEICPSANNSNDISQMPAEDAAVSTSTDVEKNLTSLDNIKTEIQDVSKEAILVNSSLDSTHQDKEIPYENLDTDINNAGKMQGKIQNETSGSVDIKLSTVSNKAPSDYCASSIFQNVKTENYDMDTDQVMLDTKKVEESEAEIALCARVDSDDLSRDVQSMKTDNKNEIPFDCNSGEAPTLMKHIENESLFESMFVVDECSNSSSDYAPVLTPEIVNQNICESMDVEGPLLSTDSCPDSNAAIQDSSKQLHSIGTLHTNSTSREFDVELVEDEKFKEDEQNPISEAQLGESKTVITETKSQTLDLTIFDTHSFTKEEKKSVANEEQSHVCVEEISSAGAEEKAYVGLKENSSAGTEEKTHASVEVFSSAGAEEKTYVGIEEKTSVKAEESTSVTLERKTGVHSLPSSDTDVILDKSETCSPGESGNETNLDGEKWSLFDSDIDTEEEAEEHDLSETKAIPDNSETQKMLDTGNEEKLDQENSVFLTIDNGNEEKLGTGNNENLDTGDQEKSVDEGDTKSDSATDEYESEDE